jgi:hypothetical protein
MAPIVVNRALPGERSESELADACPKVSATGVANRALPGERSERRSGVATPSASS